MAKIPLKRPKAKAAEPSTDAKDDPNRLKRVKHTRAEIGTQGDAIRQSLNLEADNLAAISGQLRGRQLDRITIVGCGDSWFVGIGVRLAFERLLGVPTEAVQALDYALYYHETANPRSLVIGISSSGTTPAVIQALEAARAKGAFTIGLSNIAASPLNSGFEAGILVRATRVGWPTQASTAAMAVLIALAIELALVWSLDSQKLVKSLRLQLSQLPDLVEAITARYDEPLAGVADELTAVRWLLFTGGGPHLAPACFGAAKIKELCPIHAVAYPLEEFHHYRSLKPGDPLFLVAPDEVSHARALDTAEVGRYDGGQIIALVPEGESEISAVANWTFEMPPIADTLAPIIYSVPLHLFAYHLAMAKFKAGLGYPGAFPGEPGV